MSVAQLQSHQRATLTTYSRQGKRAIVDDEQPAPKRRRIGSLRPGERRKDAGQDLVQVPPSSDTAPSSPATQRSIVFSSDLPDEACNTPPSSPPQRQSTPNPRIKRQPLSFFKRKNVATSAASTPSRPPLAETVPNAPKVSLPISSIKGKRLKQMQIDLGGDIRKACKICGMDYIPSNIEDVALHKKFHALNVGGIDFGKAVIKDNGITKLAEFQNDEGQEVSGGCWVVVVDRKSSLANRNKAKRVLEVVNTELSAVSVNDERLWGHVMALKPPENGLVAAAKASKAAPSKVHAQMEKRDRFRFYLYVEGQKCVGLCLAERIKEAYKVVDGVSEPLEPTTKLALSTSSSISVSEESDPAILGISRIWVSVSHRRKGIGLALLNCAMKDFVYGMEIPKKMVAFSQPTESGCRLARRWFGDSEHWRVYLEQ